MLSILAKHIDKLQVWGFEPLSFMLKKQVPNYCYFNYVICVMLLYVAV